jgi:hypothetical protein
MHHKILECFYYCLSSQSSWCLYNKLVLNFYISVTCVFYLDSMNLREVGKCGIFKFCFQMKPRLLQDTWSCDQIIFLYLQLGLIFFSMYLNFISYIFSHLGVYIISLFLTSTSQSPVCFIWIILSLFLTSKW